MLEGNEVATGLLVWLIFCGFLYGLFHNVLVPLWNAGKKRSQREHELKVARILAGKER